MTINNDIDDDEVTRVKLPRTRGLTGGILLVLLGAWAGLVAFIGPYFQFAYTPSVDKAWKWTAARGYLEVAPGAVAVVAGLVLMISASRRLICTAAVVAALAGAWLVVGPPLAALLKIHIGQPDPSWSLDVRTYEQLAYFFATGALIVLVAGATLGRVSVQTVADAKAAEAQAEAARPAPPISTWEASQSYFGTGEGSPALAVYGTPTSSAYDSAELSTHDRATTSSYAASEPVDDRAPAQIDDERFEWHDTDRLAADDLRAPDSEWSRPESEVEAVRESDPVAH